ncbi:hypothetical protein Mpal_1343 [Methanosphaerula palustris E1-9c]|uniref:Uncharacterized protein n=1 Tax=Methanosphaerula palustris (strain ATCC BAA-1556 / DSM 19958 / E1-9c) TaxID=521011 RepID=B8GHS1_METPE|nr:hypothetical protein Mpal_1343 [Methanosphaerula palustris E1-9c]
MVACPDECTSIPGNGPDVTGKTDERLGSSDKIRKYQKQISWVFLPDNVQIHDRIEEPIFRNQAGTITGIVSPPLKRVYEKKGDPCRSELVEEPDHAREFDQSELPYGF